MAVHANSDDSTWRTNVVSSNGTNQFSFYLPAQVSNLGPYDGWLVSELARSLGPERFEAFWKSSAPVPESVSCSFGPGPGFMDSRMGPSRVRIDSHRAGSSRFRRLCWTARVWSWDLDRDFDCPTTTRCLTERVWSNRFHA